MTAQAILDDLTARGVRVWAEADRLKLDAPAGILTDEDKANLAAAKPELLAVLAPKAGICPACKSELDHQGGDCWWCAGCRTFCHGNGRLMARPAIPKPLTLERHEAKRLLADLQAAGCGFVLDDGELRITNISKISTALWVRL